LRAETGAKKKRTDRRGSTVPWASVRQTEPGDFPAIIDLCRRVYPGPPPYGEDQLASHLEVFPAGQLTAVVPDASGESGDDGGERVVGMAASLIVLWDDYEVDQHWRDFTADGYFTNHDTSGRTLYGAEIMTDPEARGRGVGSAIYRARDELMERLGLRRIRAGARLRGYHAYAELMAPEDYAGKVVQDEIRDPTLSFQLHRGFRVISVVSGYLPNDAESLGYAAVIEKLNPALAPPEDGERGDPRYRAAAVSSRG
jgi:GNAT superfamily N-acetyltransferase